MLYRRIFIIVVIFIFSFTSISYCDDIEVQEFGSWKDEIIQTSNSKEEPKINSRAGIIYDRESKRVIWGKAENEKRPMASTTKIMSAIVVLENANLNEDRKSVV